MGCLHQKQKQLEYTVIMHDFEWRNALENSKYWQNSAIERKSMKSFHDQNTFLPMRVCMGYMIISILIQR